MNAANTDPIAGCTIAILTTIVIIVVTVVISRYALADFNVTKKRKKRSRKRRQRIATVFSNLFVKLVLLLIIIGAISICVAPYILVGYIISKIL